MSRTRYLVVGLLTLALGAVVAFTGSAHALGFALMAGATWDTGAADAMLKVVETDLFDSVVTFSDVIDIFEQNSNVTEGGHGRYIEGVNMFGYSEGIGARNGETGFLPVPGNPTFVNFRVKLKNTFAVVQMSQKLMRQAVRGKTAFANWSEVELTRTEKGLRSDLNRQSIGYGAGILAQVNDASPVAALKVFNPYGLSSATKGWLHFRRGMGVVFGPNADGTGLRSNGESATVLSVNKAGNSGGGVVTLDHLPIGVANSDFIFRGDDLGSAAPDSGVEVEMIGLEGQIDDGTIMTSFQNISRNTYDEWKSQIIDGSAAPYSGLAYETLFMQMNDDVMELGGSEGLTHIICTRPVFRNAFRQIQARDSGFGATRDKLDGVIGGTRRLQYALGDRLVQLRAANKLFPGRAFGLTASTLRRYHLKGFAWDDTTGALFRQVAVGAGIKAAFYAWGDIEMELGCTDPQQNIKVKGLSESQA
jgi:hypothetical protein